MISNESYPVIFPAIEEDKGFRRILDLERYLIDGSNLSNEIEMFVEGMSMRKVNRSGMSLKIFID